MSARPAATSAALPLDEPPADLVRSQGLRTGPVLDVWLPPEKHRSSHTALPVIVAPASSRRVTTGAPGGGPPPRTVAPPSTTAPPPPAILPWIATGRPA